MELFRRLNSGLLLNRVFDEVVIFIKRFCPAIFRHIREWLIKYIGENIFGRFMNRIEVDSRVVKSDRFAKFVVSYGAKYEVERKYDFFLYKRGMPPIDFNYRLKRDMTGMVTFNYHGNVMRHVGNTIFGRATKETFARLEDEIYNTCYQVPNVKLIRLTNYQQTTLEFDNEAQATIVQDHLRQLIFNTIEERLLARDPRFPTKCVLSFEGVPGTGKTTAVKMIALKYGWDIIKLDDMIALGYFITNRRKFDLSQKTIVLFEDFDKVEFTEDGISTLLNFLDGVESISKFLVIFTFNSIEIIEAHIHGFSRPGRIDQRIFFERPTHQESINYIIKMYETTEQVARSYIDELNKNDKILSYASFNAQFQYLRGDASKLMNNYQDFFPPQPIVDPNAVRVTEYDKFTKGMAAAFKAIKEEDKGNNKGNKKNDKTRR